MKNWNSVALLSALALTLPAGAQTNHFPDGIEFGTAGEIDVLTGRLSFDSSDALSISAQQEPNGYGVGVSAPSTVFWLDVTGTNSGLYSIIKTNPSSNSFIPVFEIDSVAQTAFFDTLDLDVTNGSLSVDGLPVLTASNALQTADLNLGSGSLTGNGDFGISLGNDLPAINDGALTISNSNRTIGNYDYSKGFLNILTPYATLALDPNQLVASTEFIMQSEEHFSFRTPEETPQRRETIAKFTTDTANHKAELIIGNATSLSNEFSPALYGNNESSTIKHYPSLNIIGTSGAAQDVIDSSGHPVITITTRVHDGDPLNPTTFSAFTNKDLISIHNYGQEPALRIEANGEVGLGTKDPEAQLHVTQDAQIDGNLKVSGTVTLDQPQGDISMGVYAAP